MNFRIPLGFNQFHANNSTTHRSHFLPHQHIKAAKKPPSGFTANRSGISGIFTNLALGNCIESIIKKSPALAGTQAQLRSGKVREETQAIPIPMSRRRTPNQSLQFDDRNCNQNLLLSDSPTTSLATTNTCLGCSPGTLTATALNMKLVGSLGGLCTSAGCIGVSTKDGGSGGSSRVSRAASPSCGATENNRFQKLIGFKKNNILVFDF